MNETPSMEQALTLALQLPLCQRLRLVQKVVASLEQELTKAQPTETRRGKHLIQLIGGEDFCDWTDLDADDPIGWMQAARQNARQATRQTTQPELATLE